MIRYRRLLQLTGLPRRNTTFRRSRDFKNLSVAKLSQLRLSLMTRLHQKMTGLQRVAVVDEVSVAREEVGGADIAEKEVDEDMVEGALTEIVVAGAVSSRRSVR